jgi:protease-4
MLDRLARLPGGDMVAAADRLAHRGIPARTVLHLDLSSVPRDIEPADPVMANLMARRSTSLRRVVDGLARAAADVRVVALVARIGFPAAGLASVQELRDAVAAFRASGKRAVAWSEDLPGLASVYLAAAFDHVVLQPSGTVGLTGASRDVSFYADALQKVGVEAELAHRHEYKTFSNVFTENRYTDAHRESDERLLESWFDQVVAGVVQGRGLSETDVRRLAARGPLRRDEALDAGLVDGVGYRDEVVGAALAGAGDGARLLDFTSYLKRKGGPRPPRKSPTIALVMVGGAIVPGRSGFTPLPHPGPTAGADTVAGAIRAAAADDSVRAIVLRVDSPGGSVTASESIWREVVRAQKSGTPVVASFGDVAGSGGYWVAMHADAIVAHPATVTGSIGVVSGKFVARHLKERIGVAVDGVRTTPDAGMLSPNRPFTPAQRANLEAGLDQVYDDFVAHVAQGRGMSSDDVEKVARGRVWTGVDARDGGLVDELGGYPVAVRRACEMAGIDQGAGVRVKVFPDLSPLALLRQKDADPAAAAVAGWAWKALVDHAARSLVATTGAQARLDGDWTMR